MKLGRMDSRSAKGRAASLRKTAANRYLIDGRYVTMLDVANECGIGRTTAAHRHRRLVANGAKITMAALRGNA